METEKQKTSNRKTADSAIASAVSQEAASEAREAQLEAVLDRVIAKQFSTEDKENEGKNRFINLNRVPLICQSIVSTEKRLEKIEGNLAWGVRIVIGAVLVALMTIVLK